MLKKISKIMLTLLMVFSVMAVNNVNVIKAEDPGAPANSCEVDACLISNMLFKEFRRDIKYVLEDGSSASTIDENVEDVTQLKSFDGEVTFDNVTGVMVRVEGYTPGAQTFEVVNTPEIQGYTPDKTVVNEAIIGDPSSSRLCFSEKVTYVPNAAVMRVIYRFSGEDLKTITEGGRTNEAFPYDPTNDLALFAEQGYEVESDEYPRDGKFDNVADTSDEISQVYIITLKKRVIQEQEKRVVTRVIEYKYDDEYGATAADTVTQTSEMFARDVVTTGLDISYGPWAPESDTFDVVPSPKIENYKASIETVEEVTVTGDSRNIHITVIYTEYEKQQAIIKIIDIDNDDAVLDETGASGEAGTPIGTNVVPILENYYKEGYELVENPYSPEILFDDISDDVDTLQPSQVFIIKLKHGIMEIPPNKPNNPEDPICRNEKEPECDIVPPGAEEEMLNVQLYKTIKYQYVDGSEAHEMNRQDVSFTRSAFVDKVNGRMWYGDFAKTGEFVDVPSPELATYTASAPVIYAPTVDVADYVGGSNPHTVAEDLVVYTKIPQTMKINFVDDKGNALIENMLTYTGGSLEVFPERAEEEKDAEILSFIENGWELVSDEYETEENKTYDADSSVDQIYVVTLKERIVIIPPDDPKVPGEPACEEPCKVVFPPGLSYGDLNKEFVRTIHHVDKANVKLLDDATQDAAERYTYEFNLVTKALRIIDTAVENYPEYKTPDIDKMTKDRDVVPADTRLENLEEDVIYTKITYTVTFIDDLTGEELKKEVVDPGDDATAPEIPVHEGYISNGWDKDFTNVQEDLVVRVTFTPTVKPVCTVKFMDGLTGKVIDVQQVECSTGAKDPGKPEHENYTPGDWDKPFDKVEVPELIVTVNYTRNKCRVMFIDGLIEKEDVCKIWGDKYTGGGLIADIEYNCGDPVTPPAPKKHDGYEFDGWEKANCSMIIYAKYRKITVKPMVPTGSNNILESLFNIFK